MYFVVIDVQGREYVSIHGDSDTVDGFHAGAFAPAAHDLLSATHTDTLADAVIDGDVPIGNVTPAWSRLAIAVPGVNVRNVLGIDNAELRPSWKTALDATNPADIAAAAAPGTALPFSHRDHVHNHPAGLGTDMHHAEAHLVNSTGPHAEAGLTIGHVVRASAAAAFAFAQLQHGDLGGGGADDHHAEVHVVNSTGPHAEAGLTIGHVLRANAAAAFSFAQLQHTDLGGVTSELHHAAPTAAPTANKPLLMDASAKFPGFTIAGSLIVETHVTITHGLNVGTTGAGTGQIKASSGIMSGAASGVVGAGHLWAAVISGGTITVERIDTTVVSGDRIGRYTFYGGESTQQIVGQVLMEADQDWTATASGTRLILSVTAQDTLVLTEALRIDDGLGVTIPGGLNVGTATGAGTGEVRLYGLAIESSGELTLDAGGEITVGTGTLYTVDAFEDAATDDLEVINAGTVGQILLLQSATSSRDVTVKNAGFLYLAGADMVLANSRCNIILRCIVAGSPSTWIELSRSTNR